MTIDEKIETLEVRARDVRGHYLVIRETRDAAREAVSASLWKAPAPRGWDPAELAQLQATVSRGAELYPREQRILDGHQEWLAEYDPLVKKLAKLNAELTTSNDRYRDVGQVLSACRAHLGIAWTSQLTTACPDYFDRAFSRGGDN